MQRILPVLITLILAVGSMGAKAEIITDFTYSPDLTNVQLISALTSDGIVPFGETEGLTYSTSFFGLTGSMVRVRNTTDNLGSVAGLQLSLLVSPSDEIRVEHNLRRLMASSAITFLDRADMIASIPSIKPVRIDLLNKNLNAMSGFGIRLHPVHKVDRMHAGIDFTAPQGTPIQATGNGKVVKAEHERYGYGNHAVSYTHLTLPTNREV